MLNISLVENSPTLLYIGSDSSVCPVEVLWHCYSHRISRDPSHWFSKSSNFTGTAILNSNWNILPLKWSISRIQDGWWQQDTCFAWSRIKIYCWSWAFCSCIIFLLFLFCTVSNCHGPWAIILYAIPIQFAKYAQVHYKVYNDRHICIHRPFWNFVGSIA